MRHGPSYTTIVPLRGCDAVPGVPRDRQQRANDRIHL